MPVVSLPDRALVIVSGPEAQHFLQTIVTADIDALPPGEVRACALLSPQGKILFDFLVSRDGSDAFCLDCRADIVADLARRLTLYRLRAKVEIAVTRDAAVFAAWSDPSLSGEGLRDTRFPTDACVRRAHAGAGADAELPLWDALRVWYGVAESGVDFALGDTFPHDVSLDQNGGVGFRKGCFVGQEVVSRMQHRGTARRRVLVAAAQEPLPGPGTEILAGGRAIGALGTVADRSALALARIDRVADAQAGNIPMEAGGVPLGLSIPPGMRFAFPQAAADPEPAD